MVTLVESCLTLFNQYGVKISHWQLLQGRYINLLVPSLFDESTPGTRVLSGGQPKERPVSLEFLKPPGDSRNGEPNTQASTSFKMEDAEISEKRSWMMFTR